MIDRRAIECAINEGLYATVRYGMEWGFKVCVAVAAVVAGGLVLIQACK